MPCTGKVREPKSPQKSSPKSPQTTFQTSLAIYFWAPTTQNLHPQPTSLAASRQTEDQRRDKQLSGEACRSLQQWADWQHFFDLPVTASQLTGTTDGPGVGKQARQLSETADSNGGLQNSWRSWMIW